MLTESRVARERICCSLHGKRSTRADILNSFGSEKGGAMMKLIASDSHVFQYEVAQSFRETRFPSALNHSRRLPQPCCTTHVHNALKSYKGARSMHRISSLLLLLLSHPPPSPFWIISLLFVLVNLQLAYSPFKLVVIPFYCVHGSFQINNHLAKEANAVGTHRLISLQLDLHNYLQCQISRF